MDDDDDVYNLLRPIMSMEQIKEIKLTNLQNVIEHVAYNIIM
jgi:hypothetical protein